MTEPMPFLIGHRGACGHAPENTLSSIRSAASFGLSWVEFDTMLSGDGQIILFHDDALDRITGQDGLTAETSFDDLRKLDVGSWFSEDFKGEKIPSLAEALSLLRNLWLGAVIEIKPTKGRGAVTGRKVARAIHNHWPRNLPSPLISSFNEDALAQARDIAPEIPRALNLYKDLNHWRDKLEKFDCVALHCLETLVDEATVGSVIDAGYELRCFTVNDLDRARELQSWGVASVFTDFPDRLVGI